MPKGEGYTTFNQVGAVVKTKDPMMPNEFIGKPFKENVKPVRPPPTYHYFNNITKKRIKGFNV